MSRIILNADDFGASPEVNAAVIRAHRHGVLTSASLMVTGESAEQAVAFAQSAPSLAVGLHLVLVDGRPALPPSQIPHLVDASGHFPRDPIRAGIRYYFSRSARKELALEMGAQFESFSTTGLSLSHVDSHMHFHVIPTIFDGLLPLASRYGAQGVRVPRDDIWRALPHDRRRVAIRASWAFVFWFLNRRCLRRLKDYDLCATERVYGLLQSGQMHENYVVDVLDHLDVTTAELYFHPTESSQRVPMGSNPGDLAALLSPKVSQIIKDRRLRLITYAALKAAA